MKPLQRKYIIEISVVDPQNQTIRDALWTLLKSIDHEFIPPLSMRESTTDMHLSGPGLRAETGPRTYFGKLLTQNIVMAKVDGQWAGVLAFRHNSHLEILGKCNPCNYLTTIGVSPQHRNIGIARSMYRFVLNDLPPELQCPFWATRTWSTNDDHLHLLRKIGFTLKHQIKNHRGDGIDTFYFCYDLSTQITAPSEAGQA
jgi:hypothetical protein